MQKVGSQNELQGNMCFCRVSSYRQADYKETAAGGSSLLRAASLRDQEML